MFCKSGSGSISARVALPKTWIDSLGITQDSKKVILKIEDETISLRKAE